MEQHPKRLLANIQILRGVAAVLVAVAHLPASVAFYGLPDTLPDLSFGLFGVDLFFVISGFILFYVSGAEAGPRRAGRFLSRRVVRVVPLYWIFTTGTLLLNLHERRHARTQAFELWHTLASYGFIPFPEAPDRADIYPIYPVGWTLNYEIFFYLCFAGVMLIAPRSKLTVMSALFVGLTVLGAWVDLPLPLSFWARSNILEFVLGMLIASALLRGVTLPGWLSLLLIAAAITGVQAFLPYSEDWDVVRGLGFGLPAAALVASAGLSRWSRDNVVMRALEGVGDASYSLYLLHPFIYDGTLSVARNAVLRDSVSLWLLTPAMLIGAILGALVLYRALERPMTRALQRALFDRTSLIPAVPPAIVPGKG